MEKKKVEFTLPWPPSVNNYYGRNKKRAVYLKPQVRKYFEWCFFDIYMQNDCRKCKPFKGKVKVVREMYPPDNRRRDEDNIVKALNDALTRSSVIKDDCQIVDARNLKYDPQKPGKVKLIIEEI